MRLVKIYACLFIEYKKLDCGSDGLMCGLSWYRVRTELSRCGFGHAFWAHTVWYACKLFFSSDFFFRSPLTFIVHFIFSFKSYINSVSDLKHTILNYTEKSKSPSWMNNGINLSKVLMKDSLTCRTFPLGSRYKLDPYKKEEKQE